MERKTLILSLFTLFFFTTLNAQTVNFSDCWKLVKITENGIDQPLSENQIALIDPNGIMAYYDIELDSVVVNGTWKMYGLDKVNITRAKKTKYLVRTWSETEIILSPMNNLKRYYYYSKVALFKAIRAIPD